MVESIQVDEFVQRLEIDADALQLIDVREPEEVEIAALDGFINLPMSRAGDWMGQIDQWLDRDKETIVMCHHGVRSAYACQWLKEQGFRQVWNLSGGIDAYSICVDRTVPRY
jgi:rhodanese-related sulfurtransferase